MKTEATTPATEYTQVPTAIFQQLLQKIDYLSRKLEEQDKGELLTIKDVARITGLCRNTIIFFYICPDL